MPMTRWEFRIVSCLAGAHASARCLKMLVMRFADVQWPAPLIGFGILRRNINLWLLLLLLGYTLNIIMIGNEAYTPGGLDNLVALVCDSSESSSSSLYASSTACLLRAPLLEAEPMTIIGLQPTAVGDTCVWSHRVTVLFARNLKLGGV